MPGRSAARAGNGRPDDRGCRWSVALALALALLAALRPPAGAVAGPAEPVLVRAGIHPGFARLVLEWPRAIAVAERQQGDRLTLRFARPLAADLAPLVDRLEGYLQGISRGGDHHEITLRLAAGITPELAVYESRIVAVDLVRPAPPAGAPPVELRTGSHPGFGRIVLDWAEPVSFETSASGRRWRIVFDHAADLDAAMIGRRLDQLLTGASSLRGDGASELALSLRSGVTVEVFEMAGARVVIDLHEAGAPLEAAQRPGTETASAPAEVARPTDLEPASASGKASQPPEIEPATAPGGPPESALPQAPAALAVAPPAAASVVPALTLQISGAEEGGRGILDFAWSRAVPAAILVRAGQLWAVFAAPGEPTLRLPALASPLPGYLGPGERVDTPDGIALRFALRRPLTAAVERDGVRWRVVLGAASPPPLAVPIQRRDQPPRLRIDAGEPARLVRLTDPEVGDRLVLWPLLVPGRGQPARQRLVDVDLLATAQGLAWHARSDDLRAEVSGTAVELLAGAGLHLSVNAAALLPSPPAAGDRRIAPSAPVAVTAAAPAPATPPVEAAAAAAPATEQAARREPVDEDPQAPADDDDRPADRSGLAGALRAGGALDLARFAGALPARDALQKRIAQAAAPDERHAARLELARWLLSRALAPEALAVLAVLNDDATATVHPDRQLLAGAAALLSGRLDHAAGVLAAPALDDDPEVALWRAALAAAREEWPQAARELARAKPILAGYPAALQVRLGLPAVRAASEAGAHDLARQVLDGLAQLDLGPLERSRLAFHQGLAAARRGAIDRADEIWRGLEDGPDDETRIQAAYSRVQMLLEAGRLTMEEALARLGPARALWRGHPWEAHMLDGLARLHRQAGDHASAIRAWHDLLAVVPAPADAARVRALMAGSFAEALLPGAATGAVRALALYRDFPELMPDGAAGVQLRRGLAAQLAELDLLEPATRLLAELLEQPPSGQPRAEAGAALAELWLRAPDPAAALGALERTAVANDQAAPLVARRRLLQARALAAANRPQEALALLNGRTSRSEQLERSEILWQLRDWQALAPALERLLGSYGDPATALAAEDQALVLRLAVARAQAADSGALARLRARFGAALRGAAGEPAFLMATMTPGRAVAPEAALAVAAEHSAQVQSYLDAAPATP
jgi:hypothetical protein